MTSTSCALSFKVLLGDSCDVNSATALSGGGNVAVGQIVIS